MLCRSWCEPRSSRETLFFLLFWNDQPRPLWLGPASTSHQCFCSSRPAHSALCRDWGLFSRSNNRFQVAGLIFTFLILSINPLCHRIWDSLLFSPNAPIFPFIKDSCITMLLPLSCISLLLSSYFFFFWPSHQKKKNDPVINRKHAMSQTGVIPSFQVKIGYTVKEVRVITRFTIM